MKPDEVSFVSQFGEERSSSKSELDETLPSFTVRRVSISTRKKAEADFLGAFALVSW